MSLSLALGILVGDVGGFKLLTSARAQARPCGGSLNIGDGTVLSGIAVRNVVVNGTLLEQAVIAGSVQLVDATLARATGAFHANGVYVGGDGGGANITGVYVGGDAGNDTNGVYVGGDEGSGSPCVKGVYVGGDGGASTNGVYVGGDGGEGVSMTGVYVGGDGGSSAAGGALTGDNIQVVDGVITGQNLLLSGAAINGGSIGGTFESARITPAK